MVPLPNEPGEVRIPQDVVLEDHQFDSTGMFHWCPEQSMSDCTIVSLTILLIMH